MENNGYHLSHIEKGILGEFSKIEEEFWEAKDALRQENPIMVLTELSDLLGAMKEYLKKYNMSLVDLEKMQQATERAFKNGRR